jgi:hypothetical protein
MTIEPSPEGAAAPPRRGPSVDPSRIVTATSPDRQRRQLLPLFACAKAPIDAILAQLANMD